MFVEDKNFLIKKLIWIMFGIFALLIFWIAFLLSYIVKLETYSGTLYFNEGNKQKTVNCKELWFDKNFAYCKLDNSKNIYLINKDKIYSGKIKTSF